MTGSIRVSALVSPKTLTQLTRNGPARCRGARFSYYWRVRAAHGTQSLSGQQEKKYQHCVVVRNSNLDILAFVGCSKVFSTHCWLCLRVSRWYLDIQVSSQVTTRLIQSLPSLRMQDNKSSQIDFCILFCENSWHHLCANLKFSYNTLRTVSLLTFNPPDNEPSRSDIRHSRRYKKWRDLFYVDLPLHAPLWTARFWHALVIIITCNFPKDFARFQ